MTGNLAGVQSMACATGLSALLTACVVVPVPSSTPLPEIVSHLPEDLRNSDRDVLVLTMHVTGRRYLRVDPPVFVKAKELASLASNLKLESSVTVYGAGLIGSVAGVGRATSTEALTALCVVVADGRTFAYTNGPRGFAVHHPETLWTVRRDAIVSSLRGSAAGLPDEADGPCGIRVRGMWDENQNTAVIEFLKRIPGAEQPTTTLARLLESAHGPSDEMRAGSNRVLVLASTNWRGRTTAEAPIFLSTSDPAATIDTIVASSGNDILPYFRPFKAGLRSLTRFSAERICAISSDGRVAWWSKDGKTWNWLGERPPYREWKEDILARFGGASESSWDAGCLPSEVGWSAEEKRQAVAFLEKLPVQERPAFLGEALLARSRALAESADARATEVMLLCQPWCFGQSGYFLTPVFLRADDFSTLIERVKSSTTREFMTFLARLLSVDPPAPDGSGQHHVYFMGSDGVFVELGSEKAMFWRERKRFQVSSAWRSDAIDVVRQDFKNLRGSDVLFLASTTGWPEETQKKVIRFLETVSVKEGERAKR